MWSKMSTIWLTWISVSGGAFGRPFDRLRDRNGCSGTDLFYHHVEPVVGGGTVGEVLGGG